MLKKYAMAAPIAVLDFKRLCPFPCLSIPCYDLRLRPVCGVSCRKLRPNLVPVPYQLIHAVDEMWKLVKSTKRSLWLSALDMFESLITKVVYQIYKVVLYLAPNMQYSLVITLTRLIPIPP